MIRDSSVCLPPTAAPNVSSKQRRACLCAPAGISSQRRSWIKALMLIGRVPQGIQRVFNESHLPGMRHLLKQRDKLRSEVQPECLHEGPTGNASRIQAELCREAVDLLAEGRDRMVGLNQKTGPVIE